MLRRRLKGGRDGIASLRKQLGPEAGTWIRELMAVQSCLGELQDREVLEPSLSRLKAARLQADLIDAIGRRRLSCWQQWLALRQALLQPQRRDALLDLAASARG